jgi:hypothetical protein
LAFQKNIFDNPQSIWDELMFMKKKKKNLFYTYLYLKENQSENYKKEIKKEDKSTASL